MKLFRTVWRGYVYQPYLQEDDVMVDPIEQKSMPHKQDMIFIRKKGNQPSPSSTDQGEEEDEAIRGEDEYVDSRSEHQGEAGPSRVRQSKLDAILHEFADFKQKPYQTSKLFNNSFRLIKSNMQPSLILLFNCSKASG